jgi:PPM family protein phosphatase
LMRGARVQQLTEDHTVQNELIRRGKLTQEQIEKIGNKRNAITRAVGVYERVDVDTLMIELVPSDQFLLTTDGYWQYLAEDQELRPTRASECDVAVKQMIEMANSRGGSDNITVILVKIYGDSPEEAQRARLIALKRDILARVPIFARLSERELLRVMQIAQTRTVAAGETLIREGDRGSELFVMLSGHVGVSRGGSMLTRLGQGENFGEMALIRSVPRSATITAESACEVLIIKRADFFDMLRSDHEIGVKMLWQFLGVLADRLDQTSGELRSAREELAAEELDLLPDGDASPFTQR